jgi:hypothetical protein
MEFPYHDVQAWLGFGCDASSEWAYVGFTDSPNLTNDDTHDGYSSVDTRVRWDGTVTTMRLTQDWGGEALHFSSDANAISSMVAGKEVLLELDWYGSGKVHFPFTLEGSSAAIAAAREVCQS